MKPDLFNGLTAASTPLGSYISESDGYFTFPILEGELANRMLFENREVICWSTNNYLGLANHPEVRAVDTRAVQQYGLAYPMGSRIMSGNTHEHEALENELSHFVDKECSLLLNYGYQGMVSAIDALLTRRDIVIYDSECHACIIDGIRLHRGRHSSYHHNDIESLRVCLERASTQTEKSGGSILVITEGVFGMRGDQGRLKEIAALKSTYSFRLLVDDAHGFGTLGLEGRGTGSEQGVQDSVDLYFSTFAKAMGAVGGFIAGDLEIIDYLRYAMRSQIFAKSLPIAIVIGIRSRLELMRRSPELRERLWRNVKELQTGLVNHGFEIGDTNSCVTPVYLKGSIEEAMSLVHDLRENHGIFCSMVVYPVIPKGLILLRLVSTALHTVEDIRTTLEAFDLIAHRLETNYYSTNGSFVRVPVATNNGV